MRGESGRVGRRRKIYWDHHSGLKRLAAHSRAHACSSRQLGSDPGCSVNNCHVLLVGRSFPSCLFCPEKRWRCLRLRTMVFAPTHQGTLVKPPVRRPKTALSPPHPPLSSFCTILNILHCVCLICMYCLRVKYLAFIHSLAG